MTRPTRSAALWAALLGLVLSIAFGSSSPAAANKRWGAGYFPDVTLTTQDGKNVKFYDLIKDRIVAIDLIYTSCQYAFPIETSKLARMQQLLGDRMGREVFFISISIDPEHDTPAVLKAYAENLGIDYFATPFDIPSADLLEELGATFYKVASGDLTNTPLLRHIARALGKNPKARNAPPRAGDVRHSQADISLARRILGYAPAVGLEEGLEKTVAWFRSRAAQGKAKVGS